jgi:GT2 family glycosyltransferase
MAEGAAAVNSVREPVCSICIANYNGEAVIGPCLESIVNQDFHLPLEIIIHDDASTDASVDFIRTHYPDVVLIASERNAGYCVSNNRMVSRARGRYILLLNNDADLHRDAIRTLYNHAEESSRPAILGLPQYDIQTGELIDRGSLLDPFLNPVPNLDRDRTDVGMVMGACLWIPKALWDELEGFPEWFGSIAEDVYLCCRARMQGHSVQVLLSSGFDHWIGRSFGGGKVDESALRTSYRRRHLSERNRSISMLLFYPLPVLLVFFPIYVLLLLLEGALLTFIKADARILNGIYLSSQRSILPEWKRILNLRRSVQKGRRTSQHSFFSVFVSIPYKLKMAARHGLPEIR